VCTDIPTCVPDWHVNGDVATYAKWATAGRGTQAAPQAYMDVAITASDKRTQKLLYVRAMRGASVSTYSKRLFGGAAPKGHKSALAAPYTERIFYGLHFYITGSLEDRRVWAAILLAAGARVHNYDIPVPTMASPAAWPPT
jgi:hypothetical protein